MSFIAHRQKKTKHPKDMTTEQAMKHLFTPKGHKLIKKHLEQIEKLSRLKYRDYQKGLLASSI